jgi:hypothetical protein
LLFRTLENPGDMMTGSSVIRTKGRREKEIDPVHHHAVRCPMQIM